MLNRKPDTFYYTPDPQRPLGALLLVYVNSDLSLTIIAQVPGTESSIIRRAIAA